MNLGKMSDIELEQMYRNCVEAIVRDKANKAGAEKRLEEINAVWRARLSAAAAGQYKADSPETGVLKTVGYQVGGDGLPPDARRQRLDYVMSGELPFVGSPAHMLEWGDPLSLSRYRKLHRVLAGFATSARSQGPRMAAAADDWTQDLAYIEAVWKPQVRGPMIMAAQPAAATPAPMSTRRTYAPPVDRSGEAAFLSSSSRRSGISNSFSAAAAMASAIVG